MANHRMFSNRVANSATFLQMPAESQLLFFHMVLRADDDGIVESYPLMKLLGTTPDSFRVLIARGFIQQLNEDQVVVISEWLEHNTIRADRKVNSMYLPLLLEKFPNTEIVVVKPRSDVHDNSKRLDSPRTAEGKLSKGNTSESGLSPLKYEIKPELKGDGSEVKPRAKAKYPNARTAFSWFPRRERSWEMNTTELKHGELLFLRGEGQVKKALAFVQEHDDEEFFYSVRKPSDLERKWNDILAFKKKHGL